MRLSAVETPQGQIHTAQIRLDHRSRSRVAAAGSQLLVGLGQRVLSRDEVAGHLGPSRGVGGQLGHQVGIIREPRLLTCHEPGQVELRGGVGQVAQRKVGYAQRQQGPGIAGHAGQGVESLALLGHLVVAPGFQQGLDQVLQGGRLLIGVAGVTEDPFRPG